MADGLRCYVCEALLPRDRWNAHCCDGCDTKPISNEPYGTPANIGPNR